MLETLRALDWRRVPARSKSSQRACVGGSEAVKGPALDGRGLAAGSREGPYARPGDHCIHGACSVAVCQSATARSVGSRSCATGARRVVADARGGRPAISFSTDDARHLRRLSSRVVSLRSERSCRSVFAHIARAHVTSRSVMDSTSEPGAAPQDALRATLLAAHKATLSRARIENGDDAGPAGGDDQATERPDVMAEADTDRVLAENGRGDIVAAEAVSVAAAVAAAHHIFVQEEAGAVRVASDQASDEDGREPGDTNHADESLAFNEATNTVRGGASAGRSPASGSTFKARGAAASDEAGTGTKTKAAAGLSSPFFEGDKMKVASAAASNEAGTGTKRRAADGLFHGEDMHVTNVKVKREAAVGAAVGASVAGNDDDAEDLTAMQLEAAELVLDKGYTAAQFEAAMKAVNDIGTVAAPLEVQLANLQTITSDDRTHAILMSSRMHYAQKNLWRAAKTYRAALREAAACDTSLDAISGQAEGVLPSKAVAWTRKATPCNCVLCSVSFTTEWQAVSVPVGHADKAGAASRAAAVAAADGDADEDVVVVGVTLAGNRAVFNPALNEAESAGKPEEEKVSDAGEGV